MRRAAAVKELMTLLPRIWFGWEGEALVVGFVAGERKKRSVVMAMMQLLLRIWFGWEEGEALAAAAGEGGGFVGGGRILSGSWLCGLATSLDPVWVWVWAVEFRLHSKGMRVEPSEAAQDPLCAAF